MFCLGEVVACLCDGTCFYALHLSLRTKDSLMAHQTRRNSGDLSRIIITENILVSGVSVESLVKMSKKIEGLGDAIRLLFV